MKVAIVGSRNYPRPDEVVRIVRLLAQKHPTATVVSGGARGPDSIAAAEARARGLLVEEVLPDWDRHGKGAGMLRNTEIVARADKVLAFWDGESSGTKDTIDKARAAGKPVHVFEARRRQA